LSLIAAGCISSYIFFMGLCSLTFDAGALPWARRLVLTIVAFACTFIFVHLGLSILVPGI